MIDIDHLKSKWWYLWADVGDVVVNLLKFANNTKEVILYQDLAEKSLCCFKNITEDGAKMFVKKIGIATG